MTSHATPARTEGADARRSAPSPVAPAPPTMLARIAALQAMGVPELRAEYAKAFGEPTNSRNQTWLFRSVAWQIQALAEGGLSERARRRATELARDGDVRPRRDVALPVAPPSEPARVSAKRAAAIRPVADPSRPLPGTVLARAYKGKEIRVRVLDDTFEYEGRAFKSLTAVAEAVTGSHWSGALVFGLKRATKSGARR